MRRFFNITLPLMTPVILYDIILGLSLGLQIFTQVYILGGDPPGSPAGSTMMYVLYLYLNAFRYGALGYAAAMAWVLFVVTLVAGPDHLQVVQVVGQLRDDLTRSRSVETWRMPRSQSKSPSSTNRPAHDG